MPTVEKVRTKGSEPPQGAQRIARSRGLPRGRAVLGGFLVAVAAVGVFAAYRRAEAPPTTVYAVLADEVAPGERLESEDLRMVALDLPPAQAATAYADPTRAVGGLATHALVPDQVLLRSSVRESTGYRAGGEVALQLEAADALGGALMAGERVDVVATYGSGDDARTVVVVREALVVAIRSAGGLAGDDVVTVRLGVADGGEALAVTNARDVARTSLVRVDGPDGADVASPPAAAAAASDGSGGR